MRKERAERYEAFREFSSRAKAAFEAIAANDKKHEYFKGIYSFYVVPGGRWGGHDDRMVDVFYGNRPVRGVTEIREAPTTTPGVTIPSLTKVLVPEHGVSLRYFQTDTGEVICLLAPAGTKNWHPPEDEIVLDRTRNPKKLLARRHLRAHWRALMSYMASTSLDGEPTLIDRARVLWIRYSRIRIVSGQETGVRVFEDLWRVTRFVLSVGLSGFLIFLATLLIGHFTPNQAALLKEQLSVLETMSNLLADTYERNGKIAYSVGELSKSRIEQRQLLESILKQIHFAIRQNSSAQSRERANRPPKE